MPSRRSEAVQEAWKDWAKACQRHGTPAIVQLCHPGRQSPLGAGNRSFFAKTVAPSAVKMDFGPSLIERLAVSLIFGTPRELTAQEIIGEGGIVDQFVAAARQSFEAGFKGVQLHGAHGYLLAQFLSPESNRRTDDFGGTPQKRAEIVLRIIRAIRQATNKEFCVGIKLNSVDAASSESVSDVIDQIRLIVECGIDFVEISGGTYEKPRMLAEPTAATTPSSKTAEKTAARESFFLEFAKTVRQAFPQLVLMVTGGFRTRLGMEAALESRGCDLIGIARPAAILPSLPKDIIFNTEGVPDEEAQVSLAPLRLPWLFRHLPVKQVGAGFQTKYYASQIQRMGAGLVPIDTRLTVSQSG
ncbi:NADPH dehydrogenase [Cladophialophora carrionii]|uniref:NADPH dehydrogenase n=1 Tax=Cladophialophora carrionii TaxID=86049 RepID=A0A1C1C982_9EURO|nr:NADPH dehydrogenase [Cladophialophora carrionii]